MAGGTKRSVPDDFDPPSTAQEPPATRSRRTAPSGVSNVGTPTVQAATGSTVASTSEESSLAASETAQHWIGVLERRIEDADDEDDGGQVVLGTDEAKELLNAMKQTVSGFLETPATRNDILELMNQLSYVTGAPAPAYSWPTLKHSPTPPPTKPSAFTSLPYDVLCLILLELRDLHCEEGADDMSITRRHGMSLFVWWQTLLLMAGWSSRLKEVCTALYRAELVVVDIQQIPRCVRRLVERPDRGKALQRMTLRTLDFELAFRRLNEDAGFALPDLILAAPNLKALTIAGDRASTYGSAGSFARARRPTFDTLTGGVSVPATIVSSLASSLRMLVFSVPCTLAEVVAFASELPSLESLDILGDVDHAVHPPGFKTVSRSLRRLWLPSTALSGAELGALLAADDAIEGGREVRVESLAFTFDPENYYAPTAPSDEDVAEEVVFLNGVLALVGADLRELSISTPMADHPDGGVGRLRIGGGGAGGGGGWLQQGPVVLAMFGAGAAGGAGGGGGGGGAPGAPGAAQGQPGGAGPAAPPAPPAAGPAPIPGVAGGPGARRLPIVAPAGRAAVNIAPGGPPPVQPHVGAAPPGPALGPPPVPPNPPPPANAGAPAGFNPFNPATWGLPVALGPPPFAEPFFETLLQHTPHVEHVELYGRRYTSALVDRLRELPLRRLALSVPEAADRQPVVNELLAALKRGDWAGLRRIELSSRGGDWEPAQRRALKLAAEKRPKLVYKSTDLKA